MGGFAWVTLATNDAYSLGALVLGHALKQTGTIGQLVVLVTPGVTPPMRAKLSAVFNVVQEVNILDSKDEKNLRLLKRPELGVTFTKLHCWHLTQFDKCVFLDADTLILSNCDELFQRDELSAAPDVGWPDCFNSGVFVFKPSNETYESLVKFAIENGSFDGGDQGLLNLFFSDWAHKDISKRLPFIYNMCSVASYSYLPAFKQFGGQVKIVHFIGVTKPWLHYFDTELKQVQPSSGTEHLKEHLQLWWNIFCAQVHHVLTPDMEGLASAFAQFTLGSQRSETQSALEDQLRRQSWEVGNIDYLGRDSFSNIWNKISETMAASQSETERKEEQITAQTDFTSIAPPKPNSESEIEEICEKPDTLQKHADPNLKQAQVILDLKQTESYSEGPPVALKDILLPTQRTASPELIPICVKTSTPFPVSAEIKIPICETKLAENELIPVCGEKPAKIESPVCETKPSDSPVLGTSEENKENPNVILIEIGPVLAAPICEKNTKIVPEMFAPICQKLETVCTKAVTVPIYVKPETICDKTTEPTEKPTSIPEQKLTPTIDLVPTTTSSPVVQSAVSNNNVAAPTTSVVAALPLAPPEKEEPTSATSTETSLKPIPTVEPIITSPRIPNAPVQCQEKAQDKLEECSPTVAQCAAAVSTEKQQESKTEVPTAPLPTQDSNTKNIKHNKKNNKNGNQDGKLQQQHYKSEKGKNIKSKPTGDVSLATMKTEEKSINPVPISELPIQEPEVKQTAVFGAVTEKVEDGKDSPFSMPTEPKSNEKPAKVRDDLIMQDSKSKKNDNKQKKDHAHGDPKCKDPQKSDNEFNNQDKKKGTDKQEKNDGKKEIVQKPEQQSQNKNSKRNNNKGDSKTKRDGDQKSDEKIEQKSEIKPKHDEEIKLEPKVEYKPEPAPEIKPITKSEAKSEQKAEVKKPDEKVDSKLQEKPENSGKSGKDSKLDDKKKGGKEHKSQAAPSSKEKGKGQPPSHKQEAIVLTPVPITPPVCASAATPAPDASPVTPAVATPPVASMPAAPTLRPAVEPTPIAPSEKPSSQTQQKESCSNGKKEAAPTPPPRKGNNVAKRGKKK